MPEKDILIELNPTYTHNCIGTPSYPKKDINYHLNKTLNALPLRTIHIWDWDDWDKILNLLSDKNIMYARNFKIFKIDDKYYNIKSFLNENHIQGNCRNKEICLGLINDNKLFELMIFGKPRYNKNYEWELLRLCSIKDYAIVGGTERLFKYFVKNYNPKSIISYCDYSKFNGNIYDKLGFKLLNDRLKPSKHWSKGTQHVTDNLLRQRGFDQLFKTNYGKGTNNEELMLEYGWLPIYDCGQYTFIWKDTV